MPSHYIYPTSDRWSSREERGLYFELSETFYGLMGGGYTMLFDEFPPVFEQVEKISGVDFDPIMPIYHGIHRAPDRKDPEYKEYENESWQDIHKAQSRFVELYNVLINLPTFAEKLVLKEEGYNPDREYFENFEKGNIVFDFFREGPSCELYQKYYPEAVDEDYWWDELYGKKSLEIPNNDWNFGHDICLVICFIELAISNGATKFRLNGR